MTDDRLLTARDAAKTLGISHNSFPNRERLDPTFPRPVKMPGGKKRFYRHSDLQRYIASLEQDYVSLQAR